MWESVFYQYHQTSNVLYQQNNREQTGNVLNGHNSTCGDWWWRSGKVIKKQLTVIFINTNLQNSHTRHKVSVSDCYRCWYVFPTYGDDTASESCHFFNKLQKKKKEPTWMEAIYCNVTAMPSHNSVFWVSDLRLFFWQSDHTVISYSTGLLTEWTIQL